MSQERVIHEAKETKTLNSILWMTYDAADFVPKRIIV